MAINIGVEASEVMASVAMLMSPQKLIEYSKDFDGLVAFLKAGKQLANSKKVEYGVPAHKAKFLLAFNASERDFLKEAVRGISAAQAIRQWVPLRSKESGEPINNLVAEKAYLTGDTWPKAVQQFQVSAYGFKSYNSSDIIFKFKNPKGLSYYGVSLKKKPSVSSPDPTLINKVFDSVLNSQDSKQVKIKKEIQHARIKYFAKVVRQATKTKPPYLIIKGGSLPSDDEQLMGITIRYKNEKRKLINLKGKGTINLTNTSQDQRDISLFFMPPFKGGTGKTFSKADMKNPKVSMRAFVNSRIASKDSVYKVMIDAMDKYSTVFAETLLNLVLKKNLYEHLEEDSFAFALVTGIGDIDKDGNPKITTGKVKGLYTVLCGLSALNKGRAKYKVIPNEEKNKKSEAAAVYLKLMKGKTQILDLELRYKGDLSGQPQFLGTLADDFKNIISEAGWGKKCVVPKLL